uniref:ERAP1-like C-terminal domain-containing protein n=1 Tax=Trichogramma kaykai TaxID=54128 RepID=A0ABD2XPA3_9HYME
MNYAFNEMYFFALDNYNKSFGYIAGTLYPPRHYELWEKFITIIQDMSNVLSVDEKQFNSETREWLNNVAQGKPPNGTLSVAMMKRVHSDVPSTEEIRCTVFRSTNLVANLYGIKTALGSYLEARYPRQWLQEMSIITVGSNDINTYIREVEKLFAERNVLIIKALLRTLLNAIEILPASDAETAKKTYDTYMKYLQSGISTTAISTRILTESGLYQNNPFINSQEN